MQRKPKWKRKCVRGCPVRRRWEACIYQRPTRCEKPPGTETPVSSGNKKMIKSDLISHRRQAKTHICHSETDATAPPSHFSLPHSQSSSHSLIHYTFPSLMFFSYLGSYHIPSQTPAPRAFKSHAHTRFLVASAFYHLTCPYNLLLTISVMGFAVITSIWSKTKWGKKTADWQIPSRNMDTHKACVHLCERLPKSASSYLKS